MFALNFLKLLVMYEVLQLTRVHLQRVRKLELMRVEVGLVDARQDKLDWVLR